MARCAAHLPLFCHGGVIGHTRVDHNNISED
jgi:hypothetical protein